MVRMRVIWLTVALVAGAGAASRSQLVEGSFGPVPTPSPSTVPLYVNHPRAIVISRYERNLPAQRAVLRLIVTGAPVPGTRQLLDIPAIVSGPLFDVTSRDVQNAENALAFAGVPRTAIRAIERRGETQPTLLAALQPAYRLLPGALPATGFSTTPTVAELLIDVRPLSDARWNTLQAAMLKAVASLKGVVRAIPAGYVLYRDDCATLDTQARRSLELQIKSAASSAGYMDGTVASFTEADTLNSLQVRENSCGSPPPLPYYAWNKTPPDQSTLPPGVPPFLFSKEANATVGLGTPRSARQQSIPGLIAINNAFPGGAWIPLRNVFQAPPRQRLVAAAGLANAFVRPDYVLMLFEVGGRNIFVPPEIPARDAAIVRSRDTMWMYIRLRDFSFRHISEIADVLKLELDYASPRGAAGFITNCELVGAPLLGRALQNAASNAGVIASAASVRTGSLLGFIDKGMQTDAVCGVPITAPIAQAVAAYSGDQQDATLLQFHRQVSAAWSLTSDSSASVKAPPYSPLPKWLHTSEPSDYNPFSLAGKATDGVIVDNLPITRAILIYPDDFRAAIAAAGYLSVYRFHMYGVLEPAVAVAVQGNDRAEVDAAIQTARQRIREQAGHDAVDIPVYLADCAALGRADLFAATRSAVSLIGGRAPLSLVQAAPMRVDNYVECNSTPEMYSLGLQRAEFGSAPQAITIVTVYPDLQR